MTGQFGAPRPSMATAGWALGLALAGCCLVGNAISTVLAGKVLKRSRETGEDHGNGFAVAALAINAVAVGTIGLIAYGAFAIGVVFVDSAHESKPSVNADLRVYGDVDVLERGDCLVVPSVRGDGRSFNRRVPCNQPHDAEVTHRFALAGDRFPGERAIDREAEVCSGRRFLDYVGVGFAGSTLESWWFFPDPDEWADGERAIVCFVVNPKGTVDQRLKGSKL